MHVTDIPHGRESCGVQPSKRKNTVGQTIAQHIVDPSIIGTAELRCDAWENRVLPRPYDYYHTQGTNIFKARDIYALLCSLRISASSFKVSLWRNPSHILISRDFEISKSCSFCCPRSGWRRPTSPTEPQLPSSTNTVDVPVDKQRITFRS